MIQNTVMSNIRPIRLSFGMCGMLVLLVLFGLAGCHGRTKRTIPKTYPVTGKVVVTQGQFPVAGCMIQFQPRDLELIAQGIIREDGSFTLTTIFHEQKLPGATEGPHRVIVYAPMQPDRSGGETIRAKESYSVEPKENYFVVKIDAPPSSSVERKSQP